MTALIQTLRYVGISGSDLSYAGIACMLMLLALVACLLPARR